MERDGIPLQPRQQHDGGWRRRSTRSLYRSQWYNLRQDELTLPGGQDITYTQVEHPGHLRDAASAMVVLLGMDWLSQHEPEVLEPGSGGER